MPDVTTEDNEAGKELADAWAADEAVEAPVKPVEEPAEGATQPKVEEPKKDEPATPEDPNKKEEPATPPTGNEKKPEDGTSPPKDPNAPVTPEEPVAPKPLTKDDITEVIQKVRDDERTASQSLKAATDDVLAAYYPDGLSNVLVDQTTGKELREPQDVVDASNGTMSIEQATKWLMNEQYKLDQSVAKIKEDAQKVAETTLTFRQNSMAALAKYEPLFKAYPQLQAKVGNAMMKYVKADEAKNVVLSAPDPLEFYDDYLEPYQKAYEFSTNQPATNPVTPAAGEPATPPAPAPGAADRLDEGGDGGATTDVDDPNDFAQQVTKELAKGF